MDNRFILTATLGTAALFSALQRSAADNLRYQFDFTTAAGFNGLFHDSVSGGVPDTAMAGPAGNFRADEGNNRAGLPDTNEDNFCMRINGGYWMLDLTDDAIALGDFQLTFRADVATLGWDDLLSFATVGAPNAEYGVRLLGGGGNVGKVSLNGFGSAILTPTAIAANTDQAWHTYVITGTTSGADALINYNVDGSDLGTNTVTGGATDTITTFYMGARHPATASPAGRNVNAWFDDISLTTVADPPAPIPTAHYWTFNEADEDVSLNQTDLYGSADLAEGPNGFSDINDTTYGGAFTGAGRSLITTRSSDLYLETAASNAFQWQDTSFSFSYWIYDDASDNDPGGAAEDLRGPRVFDCLNGDTTGIQLGTTENGVFNLRIDDDAGGSFLSDLSTEFSSLIPPRDQWVHVAVNVDRAANELTIYLAGVSQGTADISTTLTGNINASQNLQIGVINGGGGAGGAQAQGLDDLAFYPSILTPQQVSDLANANTTPLDVLISMEPQGTIPVVSVSHNAGEITVVFTSENGTIYSAFGGADISALNSWPEVSVSNIVGDGTDLSFSYTPAGTPSAYFIQIRED